MTVFSSLDLFLLRSLLTTTTAKESEGIGGPIGDSVPESHPELSGVVAEADAEIGGDLAETGRGSRSVTCHVQSLMYDGRDEVAEAAERLHHFFDGVVSYVECPLGGVVADVDAVVGGVRAEVGRFLNGVFRVSHRLVDYSVDSVADRLRAVAGRFDRFRCASCCQKRIQLVNLY